MRIAVTGTHGVGKTTLIEDFCAACKQFELVPEPWQLLSESGMAFADGSTSADLEEQLSQSCALLLETAGGTSLVFDRCPLDFLAYLDAVSGDEGRERTPHGRPIAQIDDALRTLDLIIFVPLTQPDDIRVPMEYPRLRCLVDTRLRPCCATTNWGFSRWGCAW